jgi:hypothetical protein
VALRGFDDEGPGLRFFADCAYTPDGKELFADENGVVWYKGKGFRPADQDLEGQKFVQSPPRLRPHIKFSEEHTRELFAEISRNLFDTIGNYGGYLALGAVLLYAAGQEFYEEYAGFPGLWLHGESQQGKSSVARWLIRLYGFSNKAGIPLPDSTKAGLGIVLQQYGDLPVWLEEYQPAILVKLPWLVEKLKEVYGRESGVKKTFDEVPRRIRTGVIVTGVATASDSQLRSRFCHVQIAKKNRLQDHYRWFEGESLNKFFLIGRWLMRNRIEFAASVIKEMQAWMESKALIEHSERARIVHGAPYCAFRALVGLLQSHEAADIRSFRDYLQTHVELAAEEVQEQAYVQQFWIDVLASAKEGVFGHSPAERGEIFKALPSEVCHVSLSEMQAKAGEEDPSRAWPSLRFYFTIDSLLARLRKWIKQQGREWTLDKNDLRAQMKVQGYWLEGDHRQRFNGAKSGQRCWCITPDKHPLGYQKVSDDEFAASFQKSDGHFFAVEDWVDPRKGDLFALIDSLKPQRNEKD